MVEQLRDNPGNLKRIFIESRLPEELTPLQEMANNLWWSWNPEAVELFQSILPESWESLNYNPIYVLDQLGLERAEVLVQDADFTSKMARVHAAFLDYIAEKPATTSPSIAYFSMEFGLHISVRLYSGGLGVLAGDFLKEASDQNINLCGIGLLYRYGYFEQAISLYGDQINNYPPQEYTKMPMHPVRDVNGEWLKVHVDFPGRAVHAKVWQLPVGRIKLYLLDTDIPENNWDDRSITHQLYGGDKELRLKQEILLGIGGIRALEAMGLQQNIYHCNEGHAAFMGLERMMNLIAKHHLTPDQAVEAVRASSLFTTHTPVPAGHDYFAEDLLRTYLSNYVHTLGLTWERFMALGRANANDPTELFSMSHLAIHLAQEVNGVSELHGKVSQQMFRVLYPGYNYQELHVGFVTNGIHYPTWVSREWHQLYEEYLGPDFIKDQSNLARWSKIQEVPAERIMALRKLHKKRLLKYIKGHLRADLTRRGEKPTGIFEVLNGIREDALVLGFARRFATYKRAGLLFKNLERLAALVNDKDRPVMFIFAGKAHPADAPGQQLIKDIVHTSKRPEFAGKVLFLEGYNMEMAKLLVQGVDIWLNTPTRPMEASGTSGMKACINGVMNFSVLDGWWAEGYRPDAGWALPIENTYDDPTLQDELDAETIYNILETDIIPTYFQRDEHGIAEPWVSYIRNIIAKVGPTFTMKRMMDDYFARYYHRLAEQSARMHPDGYRGAKALADWKALIRKSWEGIQVIDKEVFDTDNYSVVLGEKFSVKFRIALNHIAAENIGVEAVFFKRISEKELELRFTQELTLQEHNAETATYLTEIHPQMSGVYEYGFRMYPKHPLLPHRQDLPLLKWL